MASGHVDRESQLVRDAVLCDQALEGLAQVRDRSIKGLTLAVRTHPRAQLSVSTPHAVFVLLDGVRNVHGPGHRGYSPNR